MMLNSKAADLDGEDILEGTRGPPDKSKGPAGWPSGEACEKVDLLRGKINKAKGTPPRRRGQARNGGRL
jgi:hypothetical protein